MADRHKIDAERALELLRMGNQKYTEDLMTHPNLGESRRFELEGHQAPFAIILNCADSRVVPELIFDRGIGDLFVVRVAGNVSNPSSIASIEYAVAHLGTNLIVVLGHESCGAVGAAMQSYPDGDNGPNLNHLLSFIYPAVEAKKGEPIEQVVKCNAQLNAEKMLADSKIIQEYVNSGDLKIESAYYNLASGEVDFL